MPKGIYKHQKHTKKRKENISKALTGKRLSEETKKKLSILRTNEKNPRWKGDKAKKITLHIWLAKNKPKPKICEFCSKERKLGLANMKNHKYTRNPNDYKWLCYSCHKIMDMGWIHKSEFSFFIRRLKEEYKTEWGFIKFINKLAGGLSE